MAVIRILVQAFLLDLFPASGPSSGSSTGQQMTSLANGLALPSFWSRQEVTDAFQLANQIWAQAEIEFGPVRISERSESVPADENGMWIHFVNHLSPRSGGIAVGFVWDLPSNEGGWGGGRIAVIGVAKSIGALAGYQGRILAHELGHILLGSGHREGEPSNLMFDRRHPRVATADILDTGQISAARALATSL